MPSRLHFAFIFPHDELQKINKPKREIVDDGQTLKGKRNENACLHLIQKLSYEQAGSARQTNPFSKLSVCQPNQLPVILLTILWSFAE